MCRRSRNPRPAAARESIEEENPAAPPQRLTAPGRVNLTADNQSLLNSCRSASLTPQEKETCLQLLFNLMTSSEVEGDAQFLEVYSTLLEENYLPNMASLLTSDSDYFLEIARNNNGSHRLQELIGKSKDAEIFFFDAILCRFVDVMTDKNPYHVAIQGMQVFNEARREAMCALVVLHAVRLARDRHGYIALKMIIAGLKDSFYRDELLDKVASNALSLSDDAFGNFVVQDVFGLYGLSNARKVAIKVEGHCVELSFSMYGRHVVERILEKVEWRHMVVAELLECDGDRLMRLATSRYGNFVVIMALRVTQDESMHRPYLFWGLVNKLWLIHPRLRMSHRGSTIADFLDSINYY